MALEKIDGFEDITNWAANHHEKLDGSGYPYGIEKEKICFDSRLMGCLDMYQALTEKQTLQGGAGTYKNHGNIIRPCTQRTY